MRTTEDMNICGPQVGLVGADTIDTITVAAEDLAAAVVAFTFAFVVHVLIRDIDAISIVHYIVFLILVRDVPLKVSGPEETAGAQIARARVQEPDMASR
jgi:hypothetical protein